MYAERLILETDHSGTLKNVPKITRIFKSENDDA